MILRLCGLCELGVGVFAMKAKRALQMENLCAQAYLYDQMARREFGPFLCGIDEAGRGPLAGPVVAAAVILPDTLNQEWIYDSKKLKPSEREELYQVIVERALAHGVGVIDHTYIDQYNVLQATYEAMRTALRQVATTMPQIDMVMVDGATIPNVQYLQRKLIRGDHLSQSIAAASIVAKVTRDRIMENYSKIFPDYGFERHMGYGTPEHLQALAQFGPSPIHRLTFAPVKAAVERSASSSKCGDRRKETGRQAESLAISNLLEKGYHLLVQNWRSMFGEIDAIMKDGDTLVIVEVRSRVGYCKERNLSTAAESINGQKQQKLRRLAEAYLQQVSSFNQVRFDVVVVSFKENAKEAQIEHYISAF